MTFMSIISKKHDSTTKIFPDILWMNCQNKNKKQENLKNKVKGKQQAIYKGIPINSQLKPYRSGQSGII